MGSEFGVQDAIVQRLWVEPAGSRERGFWTPRGNGRSGASASDR